MTIKTLTIDHERLKLEISEAQAQMKSTGDDREKQNKELQSTVQCNAMTFVLRNSTTISSKPRRKREREREREV